MRVFEYSFLLLVTNRRDTDNNTLSFDHIPAVVLTPKHHLIAVVKFHILPTLNDLPEATRKQTLAQNGMRKWELSFKEEPAIDIAATPCHRTHVRVSADTQPCPGLYLKSIVFTRMTLALRLLFLLARAQGLIMETMLQ